MMSGGEAEVPAKTQDVSRPRRMKWIAVVLSIAVAAVLLVASYYTFFYDVDEGLMTMTQLADKMIDSDGDGFPEQYGPYDEGDNVTVRDRLLRIEYRDFPRGAPLTLIFSYTGNKWEDSYGMMGYVWAFVWGNVSMCSYGEGDWITLTGTVESYEWNNTMHEWMNWSIAGEPEFFEIPTIELNLTKLSNSWKIEISSCSMDCRLWHFEFLLRKYGFGWDIMEQPAHGKRSTHMEFWDADRNGCLSDGDYLYVMLTEEGEYEVVVSFQSVELAQVSWVYDP